MATGSIDATMWYEMAPSLLRLITALSLRNGFRRIERAMMATVTNMTAGSMDKFAVMTHGQVGPDSRSSHAIDERHMRRSIQPPKDRPTWQQRNEQQTSMKDI